MYRSSALKANDVNKDVCPNISVPPDGFSCDVRSLR